MAMYKVPQDVEAEDKFLGPLTFKQFLFGFGTIIFGYIAFFLITKGLAFIAVFFIPMALVCAILAFPWSREQPTDLWLASRIRFLLVPRKRIWNQDGVKDLVNITAPKREVHNYTDGLSRDQVESRLSALASVVDTRGWAIKNLQISDELNATDRLVQNVVVEPDEDQAILKNTVDVMDENTSPLTQQFDHLIQESTTKHRQEALEMVKSAKSEDAEENWHDSEQNIPANPQLQSMKSSSSQIKPVGVDEEIERLSGGKKKKPHKKQSSSSNSNFHVKVPDSKPTEEELALLENVHKKQQQEKKANSKGHLKTIQPVSQKTTTDDKNIQKTTNASGATPVNPDIMALSQNNDLNIETIQRQGHKQEFGDDEVVVSLR